MPISDQSLLLHAYRRGFFPMAKGREESEIYWVAPDRRGIIPLDSFHIPHSLRKFLKHSGFHYSINQAFETVLSSCAAPRAKQPDSWINPAIAALYRDLWQRGFAHSVEVWQGAVGEQLVGGLYGVAMGAAFFGESMFSRQTNASKAALVELVRHLNERGFRLLDAQFYTPHLGQFGAQEIDQADYLVLLDDALARNAQFV